MLLLIFIFLFKIGHFILKILSVYLMHNLGLVDFLRQAIVMQ